MIEDRAHNGCDLGDLFLHDLESSRGFWIDRRVFLKHLHVARDQVERCAHLVGNACGGLADGRHLFGARERLPQHEYALVAVDELRISKPQLGGRIIDALLQSLVKILEALQHVVQSGGNASDLVRPRLLHPGGEVAGSGTGHRVPDESNRPMNEPASQKVDQ